MSDGNEITFVDNKKAKSAVWVNFGFVQNGTETDKTRVGCRLCRAILKYSGNTTNLTDHIRRKHPSININKTKSEIFKESCMPDASCSQTTTPNRPNVIAFFGKKLESTSSRSKAITDSITHFIVKDLRPYSVVENTGFKHMLSVLEPRYRVPSRQYFSENAVPELYNSVKERVKTELRNAVSVSLTTDGWTSCATESYVTVTSCHINEKWEMKNFVLQTRVMPESHTGVNIDAVLKEAILEWNLPSDDPPLVTDNASNMILAAKEAGISCHIGCYAHTLNLACGKALKIPKVARLLGRMRRIVGYFHRSSIATNKLHEKQILLQLPRHKLSIDVQTRWNSALDMASRFLEQQPAVYAALTCRELRGKEKDISTLTESDIEDAEELVKVLSPLKTATIALCEETLPTLSIIRPLQYQLLNSLMLEQENDDSITQAVKRAVVNDLAGRYKNNTDILTRATLLDPRFKTMPFLSDQERLEAFHQLELQAIELGKSVQERHVVKMESGESSSTVTPELPRVRELPSSENEEPVIPEKVIKLEPGTTENKSPKPASAMSSLLGDIYILKVEKPRSIEDQVESEVKAYKTEPPITTDSNPLIWWSTHCEKFPLLANLAKKYLSIPATSVPSERVFSTAGDIVTAQRSALKSENVDRLIFLKKNWHPA
ncbi:E3 SUMO-protein ligase ZBED1-like [Argopecten irradians]|uniref:E3 SUMO-protein ligase ZBED1-like n=1 Tax=Argopecten irradians TaxID=31199 RepID=UPI003722473A